MGLSLIGLVLGLLIWPSTTQRFQFSQQFQGLKYADPDSMGYRQCAYWELADGTHLHSDCTPYNMERCGKKAEFLYKCCPGFLEEPEAFAAYKGHQAPKCSKMISPYSSCTNVAYLSADISGFSPQLASVTELQKSESRNPYTIFAPKMGDQMVSLEAGDYVVEGRYYTSDLKHGMELDTINGKRKLYVTRYPYGVVAVDCAELIDADFECQEGLMHKIRRPLTGDDRLKRADQSSVMRFLETHPETKSFANDLPPDMKEKLGNVRSGKRYTVLAPRSQSWDAVKSKYSGEMLQQIASSHVLEDQVCSSGLVGLTNYRSSVKGDRVKIMCETNQEDSREMRYILSECNEKYSLIEEDMATANGVVHLMDKTMVPLFARTLADLAGDKACVTALKINEFAKLIEECDLKKEAGTKYAVIVPQDEAFTWWSTYEQFREEYQRFQVDREYRCRVARYHLVKAGNRLNSMDGFASHTMGHRTNNQKNFLYETTYFKKSPYGSQLYFHYAPIPDMRALQVSDGPLYLSPKINVIPEKNISQILQERPDTKMTNTKTVEVDMENKHFRKNAPKNLYLVTTDDGWKDPRATATSINPYRPEHTMYKGKALENYLLLHHVPLYLWGGDIGYFKPNSVHKFMSSAGVELTFWMDESGVMRIGHDGMQREEWPRVVKWNLPARDGIMWLLDGVLKCPEKICPILLEDIDIYDMYVSACQTAHLPNEPNASKDFRKKPTDVASRHPKDCTVILQLSEKSVNFLEAT